VAGFFEELILPHISPYFAPLQKYLLAFWRALHPSTPSSPALGRSGIHSVAKPQDIIEVFKEALDDPLLIKEMQSGSSSGLDNCPLPSDYGPAPNCWDVVERKAKRKAPYLQPKPTRMTKLSGKRRRVA